MPCDTALCLPRTARLRRRAEYRRVYESGARSVGRYMVVFALPRQNGETGNRLGVTATRKLGGAVQRARCKRRLREVFRGHPEELSGTPVDVVLNARKGCGEAPWDDLVGDYTRSIRKVRERLAGG